MSDDVRKAAEAELKAEQEESAKAVDETALAAATAHRESLEESAMREAKKEALLAEGRQAAVDEARAAEAEAKKAVSGSGKDTAKSDESKKDGGGLKNSTYGSG